MKKLFTSAFFQLISYTVLIFALLLSVVAGSLLYKNVQGSKSDNSELRNTVSYIRSRVLSNSAESEIAISDDGKTLMLTPFGKSYTIYIYENDGKLCEEISTDGEKKPERAEGITDITELSFSIDGNVLKYSVDGKDGSIFVRTTHERAMGYVG